MAHLLHRTLSRFLFAVSLGAALTAPVVAQSVTVYDNSTTNTFGGFVMNESRLVGDVITLGGSARLLTDVTVRFSNTGTAGSFDAQVNFYTYSGGPSVGSLLGSFSSLSNSIGASDSQNVTFSGLNLLVPDQLAFSVGLSKIGTGLNLTSSLFNPPTVGSSDPTMLLLDDLSTPSGFEQITAPGTLGNLYFVAKASAS